MAFDTLQVKAVEDLLSFTNMNGHRSINGLCLTLFLCVCNNTSDLRA